MRKLFLFLLLVAALAGAAWYKWDLVLPYWQKAVYQVRTVSEPGATPAAAMGVGATSAPETAASYTGPVAPDEPQKAAPGTFFIVQRAKVISATGVKAVNPGEQVKLLERLPKGRLRVTLGDAVFELEPAQVTDDLGVAREAERRFKAAPEQSP